MPPMNPFDQAFPGPAAEFSSANETLIECAGRRVLIVDNEPELAQMLFILLSDQFDIEVAYSGEEALDLILAGERFAVVLSDHHMPGMDGVSLLGRIQEIAPLTTRMMFTGLYDMNVASRALSEGRIFRFLAKPLRADEVAQALEDGVLRHRQKSTRRLTEDRLRFAHDSIQGFNAVLEERLNEAQYAVVLSLAKLAEERDRCTGMHLDRVSAFCRALAQACMDQGKFTDQIDKSFVRDIELCAPLHDIGKVGIPDSILLKPGKLTDSDWEVMRTHPSIGAQTLDAIIASSPGMSFLVMGREVALGHHEFWNGKGYPQGLVGEATPLAARILKIADCYDALTTERPYKRAWSHAESFEHIQNLAGIEFDPTIVHVMSQIADEFIEIRARLSDVDNQLAA